MFSKKNPNENPDFISETDFTLYLDEEEDTSAKKKPIFERLGLVEPIIKEKRLVKAAQTNSEASAEADSLNSEAADGQERIDKNQIEKLTIDEVFMKYGLEVSDINTIYMIHNFLKALPTYLPSDVKRQSVLNLIAAAHVNVTSLINDGNTRVDTLKKFYSNFSLTVDEIVATNELHIKKLNERIAHHKRIIEERTSMREEQKSEIDFEIQRLVNIIEFVENK